jgi:hypothetical protein
MVLRYRIFIWSISNSDPLTSHSNIKLFMYTVPINILLCHFIKREHQDPHFNRIFSFYTQLSQYKYHVFYGLNRLGFDLPFVSQPPPGRAKFFNQKETCRRWAESPAGAGGPMRRTQQFLSTKEGVERDRGGQSVIARTQLHFVVTLALTADAYSGFSRHLLFFSPCFQTSLRLCNGHLPLLIQKGCARTGQKVQRRQVGQNSAPDSSKGLWKGERKCLAKCLSHS